MKNYVEVAYEPKEKPFGDYPPQLAHYLVRRYCLQRGMRLLDNGCGRGEFLHAFGQEGLEVYGADLSDYCKDAKVVDLNRDILPFEDNFFDVVFSKSVIEHIENTEHYIGEMRRVLRPGGLLILLVPDWETQYIIFYQDPTHIHPYTVQSVRRLLMMMEFEHAEVEKFTQIPSVWREDCTGAVSRTLSAMLRVLGPVKRVYKNKFFRFSRELMILGIGRKGTGVGQHERNRH